MFVFFFCLSSVSENIRRERQERKQQQQQQVSTLHVHGCYLVPLSVSDFSLKPKQRRSFVLIRRAAFCLSLSLSLTRVASNREKRRFACLCFFFYVSLFPPTVFLHYYAAGPCSHFLMSFKRSSFLFPITLLLHCEFISTLSPLENAFSLPRPSAGRALDAKRTLSTFSTSLISV